MRAWVWLLLIGCAGCGDVSSGSVAPPVTDARAEALPHGDHSPHHGGVVMMKGDLHYEVVLESSGRYRLYFSDAARADLPAATALHASVTLIRPGEAPEGVPLQIDESGESWIGTGKPVTKPEETTARISFTVRGEEPYWIDLPFTAAPDPDAPHELPTPKKPNSQGAR